MSRKHHSAGKQAKVKKVGFIILDKKVRKEHRRKVEGRTLARFDLTNVREICRLARQGNGMALALAWHAATELGKLVVEIAEREPGRLSALAQKSLYMPAVLSSSKSFNKDAAKVVERLNLSTNCATGQRPNSRLESLTTRLVVELFEDFEHARQAVQHFASMYRQSSPLKRKFRTVECYLIDHLGFDADDLRLLKLGTLNTATVPDWWESVFKPCLADGRTMDMDRLTPLFKSFRVAKCYKDYEVKDELKRRCQDALERLAKSFSDPSKPPVVKQTVYSRH